MTLACPRVTPLSVVARSGVLALVAVFATAGPSLAQVSLTTLNTPYAQDFNILALSGTSSVTPTGWTFLETGTNADTTYAAGTGSSNTGNTYSFGASGSTDRAFGGLLSGSLVPTIGAAFTNNTGATITSLQISYTGEMWRAGVASRGAADRLDFQVSLNATSLTSGTWTDVDGLDFASPNTSVAAGALDGNAAANRTLITFTITGLSIANGATFWIRWTDFNIASSDDGLAVDDFSLTPQGTPVVPTPGVTIVQSGGSTAVTEGGATDSYTIVLTSTPTADVTVAITPDTQVTTTPPTVTFTTTTWNVAQTVTVAAVDDAVAEGPHGATITHSVSSGDANYNGLTVAPVSVAVADNDFVITPIAAIQGNGSTSPIAGQGVTTRGVVTARKGNGFFLQTQDSEADADPLTSEGIFVFTSSTPPVAAAVGSLVTVTGTVSEFRGSPVTWTYTMTQIGGAPVVVQLATGQPLPTPASPTTADFATLFGLEKYEGMRVAVPSLTVVAPTDGFVSEPNASSTSNGVFFGVLTGTVRPFREAGIEQWAPLPAGSPATVTRFDTNPERLRVDADGTGGALIDAATGAMITGLVGVLENGFTNYTLLPDPGLTLGITPGQGVGAVAAARAGEALVASLNLERFFNNVDDPGGDPVLTLDAFTTRLKKASLTARTVLRSPDILAVVEVENLATLQALATRINGDALAAGGTDPGYQAYLVEGNDVGGIDVGFLVKSATTSVVDVVQEGKDTLFVNPDTSTELLNDRPALVLRATVTPAGGSSFPLTVVVNHLRSLNGIDDGGPGSNGWPTVGARVRAKRLAQAEFLANLVQARQTADPTERIVLVGDFNAFEFSDGYVDVMGTITGTPVPASEVVLPSDDLVTPDLTNLVTWVPPTQRYSYVFDGSAQVLDHALITQNLARYVSRVSFSRSNADQPEIARADPNSPARLSDHDGIVVAIATGTPRIVGQVVARDTAASTVSVRFTNAGTGNAHGAVVDGVSFRTLLGTGTVSLASPVVPATLGFLAPGDSVVVTFPLNWPETVSRFVITEAGSYQTAAGGLLRFSSSQAVSR